MTPPPTKGPKNLVEALAVSPYYHLLPKREISPLLSFFSTGHPAPDALTSPDLKLNDVVDRAINAMDEDSEGYKDAIDALVLKYEAFDDEKLEGIRFRKPVIASDGAMKLGLRELPEVLNRLLQLTRNVETEDLVEHTEGLSVPQLGSLTTSVLDEQYDELIAREVESQKVSPKRTLNSSSFSSRKRVRLDPEQLADATKVGIVELIDKVGLDDADDVLDSLVCHVAENGTRLLKLGAINLLFHLFTRLTESNGVPALHLDYTRRTQQLCLNRVTSESLVTLEAIVSARLLLLIISTRGLEKRLYMETYITGIADLVSRAITASLGQEETSEVSKAIPKLLYDITSYVEQGNVDERILTKLEYASFDVIFNENNDAKSSELSFSLIQLLHTIFSIYDHQRRFLIHEIMNNFNRILHQSSPSNLLRTPLGTSVSAFSLLLVRLIQSLEADQEATSIEDFLRLPKSSNPTATVNAKRLAILEKLAGKFNESKVLANMVASFCVEKLISGEANYKAAFNILLDDLLKLLSAPDSPGAETILSSLVSHFIEALMRGTIQTSNEPLALDIVGRVGVCLLGLKLDCPIELGDTGISNPLEVKELARLTLGSMMLIASCKDYIALKTLARYSSLLSKASSGVSQHGFFHSSPSKKSRISEHELALHDSIDELLSGFYFKPSTTEKAPEVYTKLILALSLNSLYDEFLTLLTHTLESSKVRLSTKAIKVLSNLIELDLSILKNPKVSSSVSKLLESPAALSRDAIIELLAKYISSNNGLLERYYMPICARTTDESIAVRKRVIRIMRDFLCFTKTVEIRSHFCIRLMKNLNDPEENVRGIAKETLHNICFSPKEESDYKVTCETMIEVITHSNHAQRSFEQYILSGTKDKKYPITKELLRKLTETALEIATEVIDTEDQGRAEKSLKLVSTFTSLDMDVLSQDYLVSLSPYVSSSDANGDICYYTLKILKSAVPKRAALSLAFVKEIQDVLLKRLTKYSVRELHEAIPTLNYLTEASHTQHRLINALISCLKLLTSRMGTPEGTKDHNSQIVKLLQLIGCFGAYCHLEGLRDSLEKAQLGLRVDETITSLLMRFVLHFTKEDHNVSVRTAAIKSLLLISSHHPKMFLLKPVMKLLNTEFEKGSHRMKVTILEGFNSFLLMEDEESGKRNLEESCSSDKKLDVDVFHGTSHGYINDSVCSSLIQSFIGPALELCLQDASSLSLVPVRFLELIMKLGFANPKVCAPTIIALESSPNKYVKGIAFNLHKDIFDKHESLADRNYAEAFKIAVNYNKRVNGDEFWKNVLFLRSVYKIVSRNYASKKRFILSLARLFTVDISSGDLAASANTRDMIVFLVLNLSVLPFLSLEEVCIILYHLDRSITHEGIDLADKVTSTVGSNTGEGMSVENLQLLFVHSQSTLALVYLRQTLSAAYAVPSSIMETFLPSRPDIELRQQPKAVTLVDFPLENLEMEVNLSRPDAFGSLFTRFVTSVKDFTV